MLEMCALPCANAQSTNRRRSDTASAQKRVKSGGQMTRRQLQERAQTRRAVERQVLLPIRRPLRLLHWQRPLYACRGGAHAQLAHTAVVALQSSLQWSWTKHWRGQETARGCVRSSASTAA